MWSALIRLGWAFSSARLDSRYVAEQTRTGPPWPYRLAGVWGGMKGSLLLFAGIGLVAATIAARRVSNALRWSALSTGVSIVVVDLVLSSPFGRLNRPAVGGFGLTPTLEHPAMTVHLFDVGPARRSGVAVTRR